MEHPTHGPAPAAPQSSGGAPTAEQRMARQVIWNLMCAVVLAGCKITAARTDAGDSAVDLQALPDVLNILAGAAAAQLEAESPEGHCIAFQLEPPLGGDALQSWDYHPLTTDLCAALSGEAHTGSREGRTG